LIDFDAILESLGAPDAAPPAVMEMLLSKSPLRSMPTPPVTAAPLPSAIDAFADLERALRDFEHAPQIAARECPPAPQAPGPAPDPVATAMLAELEAWMQVLQHERAAFAL
jgi:hypothetical protein